MKPARAVSPHPHPQAPRILALLQQGLAHMQAGNGYFAEQCFQEVTRLEPGNVDGWHMLAMLAGQERQFDKSLKLFEHALKLKPNYAEAHSNMGNICKEAGRFEEAVECYRRAVRHQPENAVFHSNLGSGYHQLGRFDEAKKAFGKAIHLDPQNAEAHCNLAVVHSVLGEKQEKVAACEKALAARPASGQAFHMLAMDRRWTEHTAQLTQMEEFLADASLPLEDRLHIGYALGKIYEDLGEYDAAFTYFDRANRLMRRSFTLDINQTQAQMEQIEQQFSKEWIARHRVHGHKDSRPVFIVGMPRSGTTLVEQILDQHTEVHGSGERLFIAQVIRGLERDAHRRYPGFMDYLPERVLAEAGAAYMKLLAPLAPKSARYITDKLPGNFPHVGFIKTILPEAKIIWCRRDPRDNAISIFKRKFGGAVPYAYDLYETGRMSAMCERLRRHWMEALGEDDILEVVYEDMVADSESQTRRMLSFLGLEWQDACREFHKNTRAVNTASYEQVRQPIYDSSIGSWKKYQRQFAPFDVGMAYEV